MTSPTPKVLTEADLAGLPRAVSLPPLPKQKTKTVIVGGYAVEVSGYNAEQMQAYARAAVQAAQPEAVGWVTAVQSFADELELPFLEAKSFLDEVFPQWMADKEAAGFVTLRLDDLIEGDSYGVDGSDFYRCRICHAESGAGMLNNGIKHEHDCPLASAPTPEPMSAPTEAKPAQPCGHPESLLLKSAETGEPLYCEACDDKSGRRDAEQRETELLAANQALREKIAALSTPAQQDAVDAEAGALSPEQEEWVMDLAQKHNLGRRVGQIGTLQGVSPDVFYTDASYRTQELLDFAAELLASSELNADQRRALVGNWFAEDWAVHQALGLLDDYDTERAAIRAKKVGAA